MSRLKKGFDIYAPVFYPSAAIAILFVVLTLVFNKEAESGFGSFQEYMVDNLSWLLKIGVNYILVFLIFIGLSKWGRVRIGGKKAKPEFNRFSWVAMLFSAGMGIGLVYFSVAEPMYHFINPVDEGFTDEVKAEYAMKYTFFHYGFHVWGIYALLGMALAFFCFNRGLPLSIRSTLYPFLGKGIYGWKGSLIDSLAVLATLFGLATSLGFGAIQFSTGVSRVFDTANDLTLQVVSIVVITFIATLSLITGLSRGLKYLSNTNMVIAMLLFLFVLFIGHTTALLEHFASSVAIYFCDFISITTFRGAAASDGTWYQGWTMFYWAWWISWSPFVGTFIARISKGRTVREMAFYSVVVPSLFSFLWMSVFGGTALDMHLTDEVDLVQVVSENSSAGLFVVLDQLPLSSVTSILTILLVATFFITSSDSGSFVVDLMTSGGKLDTPRLQKVFWASMEGAAAIALIAGGGLSALQSLSLSTGFPFLVILVVVSISLFKGLKTEKKKD